MEWKDGWILGPSAWKCTTTSKSSCKFHNKQNLQCKMMQFDEQQERRVIRLRRSNIQSFNEFQVTFNLMAKFFTIFVQKLRNRVSLRTSCRRNVTSWRGKMKTAASVSRWHGRWPTTSRRGKLDDSGVRRVCVLWSPTQHNDGTGWWANMAWASSTFQLVPWPWPCPS